MPNNHLQFQLQELNPPCPPQAEVLRQTLAFDTVPLAVRRQRVANGSKRKRDLAAVGMAEELEMLERQSAEEAALRAAGITPDPYRLVRLWVRARRRIRHSLPSSTYRVWIKPIRPTGHVGDCLVLSAPADVRAWAERRYASLIVEALEGTGFNAVSFAGGEC